MQQDHLAQALILIEILKDFEMDLNLSFDMKSKVFSRSPRLLLIHEGIFWCTSFALIVSQHERRLDYICK